MRDDLTLTCYQFAVSVAAYFDQISRERTLGKSEDELRVEAIKVLRMMTFGGENVK
jgi:hypothetical protein